MAEEKKRSRSASAVAARRAARDRAADIMAMQNTLLEIGAEYFEHVTVLESADDELQDAIDQARVQMEAAVDQARAEHVQKTAAARAAADQVIRQMLALKVSRAEVQTRLGAGAAEITRAVAGDKTAPGGVEAGDAYAASGSPDREEVDADEDDAGQMEDTGLGSGIDDADTDSDTEELEHEAELARAGY